MSTQYHALKTSRYLINHLGSMVNFIIGMLLLALQASMGYQMRVSATSVNHMEFRKLLCLIKDHALPQPKSLLPMTSFPVMKAGEPSILSNGSQAFSNMLLCQDAIIVSICFPLLVEVSLLLLSWLKHLAIVLVLSFRGA